MILILLFLAIFLFADDIPVSIPAENSVKESLISIQKANADLIIRCPEKTCYDRSAKFDIIIKNTGEVDLTNITVIAKWNKKLRFVNATRNPKVKSSRTVWKLNSLAIGQEEVFQIELVSYEPVKESLTATLTVDEGLYKLERRYMEWIGVPAISLEVIDTVDPLFLSGDNETKYIIEVFNQGTAIDRNVTMRCEFPVEINPITAFADTEFGKIAVTIQDKKVFFLSPILKPRAKIKLIIDANGVIAGNARVKTYLNSESLGGHELLKEINTIVCDKDENDSSVLLLEVIDTVDPLSLSGDNETTYLIEVTNLGTAFDRNIIIRCEFPAEIDPVNTAGDTVGTIQGKKVSFAPYPVLQPKQKLKFMIMAKGLKHGDARVKIYLDAASLGGHVILNEENTCVY